MFSPLTFSLSISLLFLSLYAPLPATGNRFPAMSDHTVSAPLLPFSTHLSDSDHDQAPEPHVIVTVDDDDGVHQLPNGDDHQLVTHISEVDDNPYAFLGAKRFDMPGSTTVDPFRNNTPRIEGVYEWFKIVVCLPLALVRLLLFGLSLMVGYVATRVALYGWKDKHNPMPKWRSRLMCVTRSSARTILFSFGYLFKQRPFLAFNYLLANLASQRILIVLLFN